MAKRFENDAIDMFVKLLKSKHNVKIIRPRIRLWNSKLKKELPGIPLQPDIDILIYHEEIPELVGVEVKAVYYTGQGKLNRKYYDGLDQSIALHMFGFDKVAFMQLFLIPLEREKETNEIINCFLDYSQNIIKIIKNLNLSIGYLPYWCYLWEDKFVGEPETLAVNNQPIFIEAKENPVLGYKLDHVEKIRKYLLDKYVNISH